MHSAETIKSTIEAKTCHKHDIHPLVEVNGDDYEIVCYNIVCCCSNFENLCRAEIERLLKPEPELRMMITSV
ncbi:MAG: hypothetical protein JWP78_330 [Mucilaginibacter sp.]|nr:hypothetical protein [Mucilaginibacter sp.]